jgi:hypothetical protein
MEAIYCFETFVTRLYRVANQKAAIQILAHMKTSDLMIVLADFLLKDRRTGFDALTYTLWDQ